MIGLQRPAFPGTEPQTVALNGKVIDTIPVKGMTLRQYYAGLATQGNLQAMLGEPDAAKATMEQAVEDKLSPENLIARQSVFMADALIAELSKT